MKTKKPTDMSCHKTKEQRRAEAIERNKRWAALTVEQQIERKTYRGYPSLRQMDRLLKKMFEQERGKK
jgi:hypothetical protein